MACCSYYPSYLSYPSPAPYPNYAGVAPYPVRPVAATMPATQSGFRRPALGNRWVEAVGNYASTGDGVQAIVSAVAKFAFDAQRAFFKSAPAILKNFKIAAAFMIPAKWIGTVCTFLLSISKCVDADAKDRSKCVSKVFYNALTVIADSCKMVMLFTAPISVLLLHSVTDIGADLWSLKNSITQDAHSIAAKAKEKGYIVPERTIRRQAQVSRVLQCAKLVLGIFSAVLGLIAAIAIATAAPFAIPVPVLLGVAVAALMMRIANSLYKQSMYVTLEHHAKKV